MDAIQGGIETMSAGTTASAAGTAPAPLSYPWLAHYPADVNFGIRVREAARRRGLLLRASHWMLALAPPLTITAAEVDDMLDILEASLREVLGTGTPDRALVGGRVSA